MNTKNFSLFNITNELNQFDEKLENELIGKDGEIIEVNKDELQKMLEEKTDGCVEYVLQLKSREVAIKKRIEDFQKLLKVNENKIKTYTSYVTVVMEGMKKTELKGEFGKIKIKKNQRSVIINDEDKKAIKALLKDGKKVEGANLSVESNTTTFKLS